MEKRKPRKSSVQFNFIFLIFFIFFLLSFATLIYGILNSNKSLKENNEISEKDKDVEIEVDEESLSKYFEKTNTSNTKMEADKYILNDPFLNQCLDSSGDNLPSINANTVCLR
ncbi:hypothetical protein A2159_00945 [Candidatus Woesebacteria bacterium RBG_13_34_9]|uniref:Uncharacterized protein n=1 Tax=Candidatus Woesebacteria bacterium RBG_13_34_9 TaxID=1802477 RepID=A0A1F7X323_9BACT|nr:MAG: hypothetical protein A2159_00945 [Candidatus Woesebacteria bacterium RBG_13_34_9]